MIKAGTEKENNGMAGCQFHQILAWKWSVICGPTSHRVDAYFLVYTRWKKNVLLCLSLWPASNKVTERRQKRERMRDDDASVLPVHPTNTSAVFTLWIKRKIYDYSYIDSTVNRGQFATFFFRHPFTFSFKTT